GDPLEGLAQLLGDARGAQAGCRVEQRQQEEVASPDHVLLSRASDLGDAGRLGGEELRGEVAESADHLRLDQLDLLLQVRTAGVDRLRLWIPVSGRAALEDVRDEHILALQPDALEQLGEETAGPADER